MSPEKLSLLSIIELGGYPNFTPVYEGLGYEVTVLNSQRKARNYLKKQRPNVIVCEYNFQTDFRDRTSNLETLMAVCQKFPDVKVVVFYMPEHREKFEMAVKNRFAIHAALTFPIDQSELEVALTHQD